jgi:asparagine synthase (glutamine-hydrolysing)
MCGIAGILNLNRLPIRFLSRKLEVINELQKHRGPDAQMIWTSSNECLGFAHQRLCIIDLNSGSQPMSNDLGYTICYNGEIYNYIEIREELRSSYVFKTSSDTEVVIAAFLKWGKKCVDHFRGMFAFAIWNENTKELFCARDRFGIKPFYYYIDNENFYFASEIKALLPFIESIEIEEEAFCDYLHFQFYLQNKTLFKNIYELKPAHYLEIKQSSISIQKYWEVYYTIDFGQSKKYFEDQLKHLIDESVKIHCRSDVPIGAYVSGGIDSGIIATLAKNNEPNLMAFTGKFSYSELYDESKYAREVASNINAEIKEIDITSRDFIDHISKVIYHLDCPIAGPGSFPQFMVSSLAAKHRKVVLGGQGGDEIFGGYTRYLIAYFEQCIKGAIDGTLHNGNFVVTYESIIPNLTSLQNYKPLLKEFFSDGLFDDINKRYYRLVNRANDLKNEINWQELGSYNPFENFRAIFDGNNIGKESYFDKMTHFDFKTLLPALLQVEDRMSMAHKIESRVPFLDHKIVELAATIPADSKFKDGKLKLVLLNTYQHLLPKNVIKRKNKMGFPVPLNEWAQNDLKDFIFDIFNTGKNRSRRFLNYNEIEKGLISQNKFGRKLWGLLSLELWYQNFYDQHNKFKKLI